MRDASAQRKLKCEGGNVKSAYRMKKPSLTSSLTRNANLQGIKATSEHSRHRLHPLSTTTREAMSTKMGGKKFRVMSQTNDIEVLRNSFFVNLYFAGIREYPNL